MTSALCSELPAACVALGISPAHLAERPLALQSEASALVCVERSHDGCEYSLTLEAAAAWYAMQSAADAEGITLTLVSAFRSIARQAELIQAKCTAGIPLEVTLRLLAPPGFSEHHTGRAIDLGTPGCAPADVAFEHTPAFFWLQQRADAFGFVLSYPRDNPQGFVYEPWHWCFHA